METMTYVIALLLAGAFAGLVAGLFGVGGGVVMVPVLFTLFGLIAIPEAHTMQVALATSLATIAATALSSARAHHRRNAVNWPIFWQMCPTIALGALLGTQLADMASSHTLTIGFIIAEFLIAITVWRSATRPKHASAHHTALLHPPVINIAGGIVGTVSALGGIGGGTMNVPYLSKGGLAMQHAVGTASAIGFPIAVAGTLGYIYTGWDESSLTGGIYFGYIHWPAWLSLVFGAVLVAPVGARLAHALPAHALQRYFAIFLLSMATWMVIAEFVLDLR